ncbi:unnamed protein product, partial [Cercopithifilaria johnstoni]
SISEKRHMGVENDANNTMLFQKIKHNRQMSAPILHHFVPFVSPARQSLAMSSSRSATSLREKCRRRSLALLRSSDEKTVTERCLYWSLSIAIPASPNRRSLSLESMETRRSPALAAASAHSTGPTIRDVRVEQMARRGHPNTLKRAQKSRFSGHAKPSISDVEDQTSAEKNRDESYASLPREVSTASKEKQQRRKSIGNSIFSKITQRLGGSRSRDTSPEKSVSFDIAENNSFITKTNRTQDYRKLNKESKSNQSIRRAPPPYKPSSCEILQSADSDYYMNEQGAPENLQYNWRGQYQEAVCNNECNNGKGRNSCINPQARIGYGNDQFRQQQQQQYAIYPQHFYTGRREQQQQRMAYYTGCSTDYYDIFNAWFAYSAAAACGNIPIVTKGRNEYPSHHTYFSTAAETVSSNRAAIRQIHHERFRSCPTQFVSSGVRTRQNIERVNPYYATGYTSHSSRISDF